MSKHFKIGDSVIALSSAVRPNQPRIKGNAYIVSNIMFCPKQGYQLLNIDSTPAMENSKHVICKCGSKHYNGGLAYTYYTEFVLDNPIAIEQTLIEAVQTEDYEKACVLRDISS